jgi:hypothetical protein
MGAGTIHALVVVMAHHANTAIDEAGRAPAPRPDPDLQVALRLEPVAAEPPSFLARTTRAPSRRLMLAVLADAVATFRRTAGTATREDATTFAETARWFTADDASEPFGFVGICRTLGLDAAYLRQGLKSVRARARMARHAPALH